VVRRTGPDFVVGVHLMSDERVEGGWTLEDADPAEALGLTSRERDVLRLVAAGRSNRQIAEELFISPKTASVHVSNILGKLDVSGRGEAAALAHRLRLFPQEAPAVRTAG
ncbi:LuxR C-terminal-related transcriptional regulator, partial [Streptomyces sp. NPDC059697]|uniref:response regulator transcription factor n=1 Tax=Streptomyces sp. NPDC059697 TaxID=3346912 RepID=UPI00368610EF